MAKAKFFDEFGVKCYPHAVKSSKCWLERTTTYVDDGSYIERKYFDSVKDMKTWIREEYKSFASCATKKMPITERDKDFGSYYWHLTEDDDQSYSQSETVQGYDSL